MTRSLGHLSDLPPLIMSEQGCSYFTWSHTETYLEANSSRALHVLLLVDQDGACTAISDQPMAETVVRNRNELTAVASASGVSTIELSNALPLTPVHIPKPWGKEIWYSGIESRGISLIQGTPIAWVLDIFGDHLGCKGSPLLLKILDPSPQENLGDLYFEMHEEKIEVYVVTSIDTTAWPDGTGAIRYGFSQTRPIELASREAFLGAYVDKVSEYQVCRDEIDALLESEEHVAQGLLEKEKHLREEMYAFTELKPLKTGDIVTVRPHVPHSLQHGVRVVEFQTPHYERYILSFGQKVLTQDHWDTHEVFAKAETGAVEFDQPKQLTDNQDLVADFDEFRVTRIELPPGDSLDQIRNHYTMLIGIKGTITLDGVDVNPEEAFFIPQKKRVSLSNRTDSPAVFLVAEEATA